MSIAPRRAALSGLALIFLAVVAAYCVVWIGAVDRTPDYDIGADVDPETLEIVWIQPGGPAEVGGLKLHDRVTAINGSPVVNRLDLIDRLRGAQPGGVLRVTVMLAGLNLPRAEELLLGEWERPSAGSWIGFLPRWLLRLMPLMLLAVAAVVLLRGPDRREAWLTALIATGMIATAPLLDFFEKMPPDLRTGMLAFKLLFAALAPALLYYLFSIFPERSELDRSYPQLKDGWVALSIVAVMPFMVWSFNSRVSGPWQGAWPTVGMWLLVLSWTAALALSGFALWQCAHDSRVEEIRRRARLAGAGLAVAAAAIVLLKIVALSGLHSLAELSVAWRLPAVAATLLLPAAVGYAILAVEPLPVGVVVRRSARSLLVGRGSRFATLDRWLFRSVWQSNRILDALPGQLAFADDSAKLIETLERELTAAYEPVSLAIYLRSSEEGLTVRRGKVPAGMQEIRDDLTLPHPGAGKEEARRLTVGSLTEVVCVSPDCIVPLRGRAPQLLGLIVLGARATGEPFSREDLRRLGRVANEAGLALERFRLETAVA